MDVDDEHDDGGVAEGGLRLHADAGVDPVADALVVDVHDAAGVDEREALIPPEHLAHEPVAGDAGLRVHDGDALARDAVEHGRFADVRPAHDGDDAPFRPVLGPVCF